MEIKKNKSADLERGRWLRLLLGFFVSLALFLLVLEIPFPVSSDEDLSQAEMEDLLYEMDMLPLRSREEPPQVSSVKKQEPTLDQIEVVDKEEQDKEPETELQKEENVNRPEDVQQETAEEKTLPQPSLEQKPVDYLVVEVLPEYPGGPVEFMKWLTKNLRYPAEAIRKKVQGKVVAQFIVNDDGSITELKIIKSLNAACDQEALRVLRMMPKWKPGLQNDKPCRTMVAIPIVFRM